MKAEGLQPEQARLRTEIQIKTSMKNILWCLPSPWLTQAGSEGMKSSGQQWASAIQRV